METDTNLDTRVAGNEEEQLFQEESNIYGETVENTEQRPVVESKKRVITVEPVLLLTGFIVGVFAAVLEMFPFHKVCVMTSYTSVADVEHYCFELTNATDTKGRFEEIETQACNIKAVLLWTVCLSSLITTLIYGTVSDKYGRKPVIVVSLTGQAIWLFLGLLCAEIPTMSPYYLAIGFVINGFFTGGLLSLLASCYAVLVDYADESDDQITIRQSIGTAALTAGIAIGGGVSWLCINQYHTYSLLFIFALIALAIAVVYTVVYLKDRARQEFLFESFNTEPGTESATGQGIGVAAIMDRLKGVNEFVRVFTQARDGSKRLHLLVALLFGMLFYSLIVGSLKVQLGYLDQSTPFGWSKSHYAFTGYLLAALVASGVSFVIVAMLKRWLFRFTDLEILIFAVVLSIAKWLLMAFVRYDRMVYVGAIVSLGMFSPVCQAFIAKQVDRKETARAFSVLSLALHLGPILVSFAFSQIYVQSQSSFPGIIFLTSSVVQILMLLVLCVLSLRSMTRAAASTNDRDLDRAPILIEDDNMLL